MTEIFVGEEHVQVYDLWKRRGDTGLALSHVDFHCDMRGLLIDRARGRAHLIDASAESVSRVDSGNFIAHAIMQGIVTNVRWIHDSLAGRRHDTGTVKYATDLTALPHRLLHALRPSPEVDVHLETMTFEEWDGVRAGEHLDIDWDGLASVEHDLPRIRGIVDRFLAVEHAVVPSNIYLVYSPGYSHPDRSLFDDFIERLAKKFSATVVQLPAYTGPPHHSEPQTLVQSLERRVVLGLRRVGIY